MGRGYIQKKNICENKITQGGNYTGEIITWGKNYMKKELYKKRIIQGKNSIEKELYKKRTIWKQDYIEKKEYQRRDNIRKKIIREQTIQKEGTEYREDNTGERIT